MTMRSSLSRRGARAFGPALALILFVILAVPEAVGAQVTPAATSPQMRHFWHVFGAYAIAWILLLGWLISIGRRLAQVEKRIGR